MGNKIFRAIQVTLCVTLIILITVRMICQGVNIIGVALLMMNVFSVILGIVSDRGD